MLDTASSGDNARAFPSVGRDTLHVAWQAQIVEVSLPEGRLLLHELMLHAVQPQFVHTHKWRQGDLVIWDNRCTMHRATPFSDTQHRREMRRVTTLDLEELPAA